MSTPQFEHAELVNEVTVVSVKQLESLGDQFVWMSKAIARVRELHIADASSAILMWAGLLCAECEEVYPCKTVRILEGEQE